MQLKLNARRVLMAGSLAVFGCLMSSGAYAQYRTSIQGSVTDPDGAVVPGAKLSLIDKANNATQIRTSGDDGVYNFNALPADSFKLTVEKSGFQTKVLDNLQLIPEQPNSITVKLVLGGIDQTVTVDASSEPALDTATSNIGTTVSSNDIQHLPSSNRDVFTLSQLAPGVVNDGSQGAGGGVYNTPGNQGPGGSGGGGQAPTENGPQSNANGGQYGSNGIAIDGISTVSAVWGGTSIITPTQDSIDNVRIVTNDYDAENGRFSGAQTLVTSKSGTNQLHGSLFFAAHRPGLNAYQRSTGTGAPIRDTNRFNQYGGSIGGPILKDRIFAFFAYESSPNNSTATGTGWYDTAAFDALAPSGYISNTYTNFPGHAVSTTGIITNNETCTTIGLVEGVNCRTIAGAGLNIGSPLTSGRGTQDPTATGLASNPGIGSGLTNTADIADYATSSPYSSYYHQYNGRMDADATNKDHLSFTIYWVPQGNTSYNTDSRAYNLFHHAQINDAFSVIWNHTFSPTLLNEARANAAGWRWNEVASNPQSPVGLPVSNLYVPPNSNNNNYNIGSIALAQFGVNLGSDLNQWTYGYKDVATKIHGQQTIKFGGDFTQLHYLNYPIYSYSPTYNFYNVWDFLNDAPMEEKGAFNSTTGTVGGSRQDDRENLFGLFVQDDWKLRPNLTLHAGLRYSYFGSLYTKQNNVGIVTLGSGSALYTGLSLHQGGNIWTPQKGNFGPQLGFNWSPEAFHNKMVVRGGYGLNFNQEEIAISANGGGNPPGTNNVDFKYSSPTNQGTNGADILYAVSSDIHSVNGYPSNPHTITTFNTAGLPTAGNAQITNFPSKLPTAYSNHYSLDAEYDFGKAIVASVGYEGSSSRHLITQYNSNALAIGQGVALNPLVTNIDTYGNSGGSNNNAFLAEIKHPFSHHYSIDAQFMWSKSMDDGSGPYEEGPYPNQPYYNYGRSDYNIGKSLKVFGLWQPVIFHGNGMLEKIAGGWSLSGIMNLHTGFPWTPTYSTAQSLYCSNCGYTTLYPNYLGGGRKGTSNKAFETNSNFPNYAAAAAAGKAASPTATINGNAGTQVAYTGNPYFSVPNFAAAMTGTFPSTNAALPPRPGLARNSFDGPNYRDIDASISKGFGIPNNRILGDNAKLEIRADALNLFNLLNLNPQKITTDVTATNFGQDYTALGSRTVSFQARFSF
jgi:hypothetical protein